MEAARWNGRTYPSMRNASFPVGSRKTKLGVYVMPCERAQAPEASRRTTVNERSARNDREHRLALRERNADLLLCNRRRHSARSRRDVVDVGRPTFPRQARV